MLYTGWVTNQKHNFLPGLLPARETSQPFLPVCVGGVMWWGSSRLGVNAPGWPYTYATPAAGGIIYNLSVFINSFLARPYGLTIANFFIPSSLGGHKLLEHWRKISILKFYTVESLYSCQFWRVSLKKSENWPTSDQNYHILKVASVKTKVGFRNKSSGRICSTPDLLL